MDGLAVELLEQIFLLACTDNGSTAISLASVSHHVRAVSRGARYHSVSLLSRNPLQVSQFYACYLAERNEAGPSSPPKVRHLLLASALRQIDPRRLDVPPGGQTGDVHMSQSLANVEEAKHLLRAAADLEQRKHREDVIALLRLLAPDLYHLSLLHCHRYSKLELCLPEVVEVPGGFPLLRELTVAGSQVMFVLPEGDDAPLYPMLERLHLNLIGLTGTPTVDVLAWVDLAPSATHLRVSNVNYWPPNAKDSLKKLFESDEHQTHLQQIIVQPHAPPPMGGPCGTPHWVFTSFIQMLEDMCRPSAVPTTLIPAGKPMKEPGWEALARAHWSERVFGGMGCWNTGAYRPQERGGREGRGEKEAQRQMRRDMAQAMGMGVAV